VTLGPPQNRTAPRGTRILLGALCALLTAAAPAVAYDTPTGLTGPAGYDGPAATYCPPRPADYGGTDDAAAQTSYVAQELADACILAVKQGDDLVSTLGDTGSAVQNHADALGIEAAIAAGPTGATGPTGPAAVTLSPESILDLRSQAVYVAGALWFALGAAIMLWFGTRILPHLLP
jgi:hypothetical protein